MKLLWTMSFSSLFGLALLFACPVGGGAAALRRRAQTVVTTSCSNFRSEPYPARLDIFYFYLIEYQEGTRIQLSKLNAAIAHSIATALHDCDEQGRPLFAVKLDQDEHVFASAGTLFVCGLPLLPCAFVDK